MDFNRLKTLVRKLGGLLVLEGGEPELVILPYEKYQKLETELLFFASDASDAKSTEATPAFSRDGLNSLTENNGGEEQETMDKLNQEILVLKEEIRQKEASELLSDVESAEVVAQGVDLD